MDDLITGQNSPQSIARNLFSRSFHFSPLNPVLICMGKA